MSIFTKPAEEVFDPVDGSGLPRGADMGETQTWAMEVEWLAKAAAMSGGLAYALRSDLYADLAHDANTSAWVIADPTVAYNGIYGKVGASGTGSWTRLGDLPAGDPGPPGSADIVGTSATSLTIGLGAKMFTTQANKGWGIGARLRASVTASPDANWMEGVVTAYSGSSLTISVDATNGAGTHAGWTINLAGQRGVGGARETLSATRTYYVSTTGSNSNNGLSAGAPFLTLQKAADEAHKLDCSVYDVNIQLVDGTYSGAGISRPLLGGGTLYIIGNNTTPANVVITSAITVQGGASVSVSGVRFVIAASYVNALNVLGGAKLIIDKVDFGPQDNTADHISGLGVAEITLNQDYTISGGARRHLALTGAVYVTGVNRTITLTGTPAFSADFWFIAAGAAIALWNPTFTGSATGRRYTINTGGVVNLYGKPTTFLPGDVAGTTASGGVYA